MIWNLIILTKNFLVISRKYSFKKFSKCWSKPGNINDSSNITNFQTIKDLVAVKARFGILKLLRFSSRGFLVNFLPRDLRIFSSFRILISSVRDNLCNSGNFIHGIFTISRDFFICKLFDWKLSFAKICLLNVRSKFSWKEMNRPTRIKLIY